LIPFIDFLLCIVLFLLASFSASGELPIDKSITLPSAENVEDMKEAPMVAITGTQILVDGVPAGSVRAIEDANRLQKVEQLFDILKAKRELWTQVHPGKAFHGICILQVDVEVPALIVKSVFQTAAYAGFPNVSFMVKRRGGEE
jgi:biopolymer transport protein ExbD